MLNKVGFLVFIYIYIYYAYFSLTLRWLNFLRFSGCHESHFRIVLDGKHYESFL